MATILERALQALEEYERARGRADNPAVLPFAQLPEAIPVDAPPVCPAHPRSATWWNRQDGGAVCGKCHPDPFAVGTNETERSGPPSMPEGVTLLAWEPKQAPVALSMCSVVIDTQKFAVTTLQQLDAALRGNSWAAANWSVRDLCERLEEVGIRVAIAQEG